jgi:CheY-like chemotaxis protein
MSATKFKSDLSAAEETRGQVRPGSLAPEPPREGAGPDEKAFAELISKGAEEIQDHLSLVARIQVRIGRLLETSIEELERAQRLETLTSLIAGNGADQDRPRQDEGPDSGGTTERPGAYLEREIKSLKKMQKLLGIRNSPSEEAALPAVDLSEDLPLSAEAPESDAPRKILIVNHDPGTVRVLRYFLEKEDYVVLACSNGPDGLQKAIAESPDVVLLDILLSGMDGYQVLSRLKKNGKTARIPVFVMSVLAQEADILKAIEAGAADYFAKPFSPHIIIAKIRRALRVRHE